MKRHKLIVYVTTENDADVGRQVTKALESFTCPVVNVDWSSAKNWEETPAGRLWNK